MLEPVGPCFCLLPRFCLRVIDPDHLAWAAQRLRESQVGLLGWRAHSLSGAEAPGTTERVPKLEKVCGSFSLTDGVDPPGRSPHITVTTHQELRHMQTPINTPATCPLVPSLAATICGRVVQNVAASLAK